MEAVGVPPGIFELLVIAPVVILSEAAVSGPPAPLQYALVAAQIVWDNVPEFVCLGRAVARWQVEALWVPFINRLAVSVLVRAATRKWLWTHQLHPVASVVDRHLKVTKMVGCDLMLELDHLTTGVGRSDGFFA